MCIALLGPSNAHLSGAFAFYISTCFCPAFFRLLPFLHSRIDSYSFLTRALHPAAGRGSPVREDSAGARHRQRSQPRGRAGDAADQSGEHGAGRQAQ